MENEIHKTDILICQCGSVEHQVIVWYDKEDDFFFLHIHLNRGRKFFRRLIHAIKYIFGYTSRFGDWDEIILDRETVQKILTPPSVDKTEE